MAASEKAAAAAAAAATAAAVLSVATQEFEAAMVLLAQADRPDAWHRPGSYNHRQAELGGAASAARAAEAEPCELPTDFALHQLLTVEERARRRALKLEMGAISKLSSPTARRAPLLVAAGWLSSASMMLADRCLGKEFSNDVAGDGQAGRCLGKEYSNDVAGDGQAAPHFLLAAEARTHSFLAAVGGSAG